MFWRKNILLSKCLFNFLLQYCVPEYLVCIGSKHGIKETQNHIFDFMILILRNQDVIVLKKFNHKITKLVINVIISIKSW
jgi:hypothetical protein